MRTLAIVVGLAVALSILRPAASHASYGDPLTLGDLNSSGTVDSIDALFTLYDGAGVIPFPRPYWWQQLGDVNRDNVVDSEDGLLILQFHARLTKTIGPLQAILPTIDVLVGGELHLDPTLYNIEPPGLGLWVVDLVYDPTVISVTDCVPKHGGVCNPEFALDTVRFVGSTDGLIGDTVLGRATVQCDIAGSSPITILFDRLEDNTPDLPADLSAVTVDGLVTCTP